MSASILLYSPGREVLSVAIYGLHQNGAFCPLSALAFLQIAISLVMLALAKWLARLDRDGSG